MRSDKAWRVTISAKQNDESIKGEVIKIYGPYQPQISMASALREYTPDIETDETDIEFTPVRIERIGYRELFGSALLSLLLGLILGQYFF